MPYLEALIEVPRSLLYYRYDMHSDDSRNYVQLQNPNISRNIVIVLQTSIKILPISLLIELMGLDHLDGHRPHGCDLWPSNELLSPSGCSMSKFRFYNVNIRL